MTPVKKQLLVLVIVAVWVNVVTLTAIVMEVSGNWSLSWTEVAVRVLLYSVPALSFGPVAFWWFGRKTP
jgi:hypothetical protein